MGPNAVEGWFLRLSLLFSRTLFLFGCVFDFGHPRPATHSGSVAIAVVPLLQS